MTTHIVLTLVALVLFFLALRRICQRNQEYFPWLLLNIAILLVLPISFSGMTSIAHYLFESSSDNLWWYVVIYVPLWLWCGSYVSIIRRKNILANKKYWTGYFTAWFMFGLWGIFAFNQSHYERGNIAPIFPDDRALLWYWITIQVFVVALLGLLIHYSFKNVNRISILFSSILLIAYSLILLTDLSNLW